MSWPSRPDDRIEPTKIINIAFTYLLSTAANNRAGKLQKKPETFQKSKFWVLSFF